MSVRDYVLESVRHFVSTIFHKPSGEFHQIYNFGAFGDKDELIRF